MKTLTISVFALYLLLCPASAFSQETLGSYEEILKNDTMPQQHINREMGNMYREERKFQAREAREMERARVFKQDQDAKERDFRRAFPNEPVPPQDRYKTYEGSRPPRGR